MVVRTRSRNAAFIATLLLSVGISACSRTESTATLLADAKQYQQKGDNKAALIQLKNAVAKSAEDGEARFQLAALYSQLGDPVSTEKEIRKASALGIGADRTLPILAKSLIEQGKFQQVIDAVAPDAAAKSAPLSVIRGNAYLALRDATNAKASFEQALSLKADSGEALVGLSMYSLVQKDMAAAKRYSAESLVKAPKSPDVWMFNGALLRQEGKFDEALAAYDHVLQVQPANRAAHLEKAVVEIGLDKLEAAHADLDAARKLAPGNPMVNYVQALLEFREDKYAAAKESLQKILRVVPDSLPTLLLAGQVDLKLGATQEAVQHLKKYLEARPKDVAARKLMAQALLQGGQPADAAALLVTAIKESPQDAQLLALVGESYLRAKDFGKASEYLGKASVLAPDTAQLHTSLGLSKLGLGDQAAGVSELERATALDPKAAGAGLALATAELRLRHFDKAMTAVEALLKQRPDDAQVHNVKGVVLLGKNDIPAARASFEKAVALQPGFLAAVANLAQIDMRDKRPEAAKKRFEAVLEQDKKNLPAMMALAELGSVTGNADETSKWLEKAIGDHPEAVAPAVKLAEHYRRTKQEQKALTVLRKAQTAHPSDPSLIDALGQAQVANQDLPGALDTYSKLVKVVPNSALAHMRLGTVHRMLKNDGEALQDMKRAIAIDPKLAPARIALVDLTARSGNGGEALALIREAQKIDPKWVGGYTLEGELQLGLKKPALALAPFEKAFEMSKSPLVLIKLAEVMKLNGKDPAPRLAQWQKENPTNMTVPIYLAEADLAKKQFKPAADQLEAVLKIAPNEAVALNNLAWAYQQLKDPRALATAEKALAAAPASPAVLDTLGWILLEQGNTTRAVPVLQKAVSLAPAAAELRYHLVVALNKSGDKKNARMELDKLLSDNKPFPQIDEAKALLKQL